MSATPVTSCATEVHTSTTTAEVVQLHPLARTLARLTGRSCKTRGRRAVPLAELERRVTRKALMVWAAYAAFRDEDGTCWPSRETVSEVASDFSGAAVTPEDVRVALRGLKRVGLIRDIRWLPLRFHRKVYYREVRGRVFQQGSGWFVSAPDKVIRAMLRSPTRGGRRPGAGRRPEIKRADALSHLTPGAGIKSAVSSTPPLPPLPPPVGLPPPSEEEGDARCAGVIDLKEVEELGFLPPGQAYGGLQYAPGTLGIPRRPAEVLGRLVSVPAARPLTKEELRDTGAVVRRMCRAYEGAALAVTGRRPKANLFRPSADTKQRMLALAVRLAEIGASPESWFLFSANCWRGRGTALKHMLDVARLERQRGWFKSECRLYACAGRRTTAAERELGERHSFMLTLLWHLRPQTEEGVRAVVERVFPGDLWGKMVADARREMDAEQASIDARVKAGEFVWG